MNDAFTLLWRWIVGPRLYRLQFFMRSGNQFILDGVESYEIENRGDEIFRLHLKQKGSRNRLLVKTIALAQIEAIVVLSGKTPA